MRMGIGLLSLLVVTGIILWMSAEHTTQVVKTAGPVREQAQQMSGRDAETGAAATDALKLEMAERGGKTVGARVVSVTAGSAIETYYGLKPDDVIVQAGDFSSTITVTGLPSTPSRNDRRQPQANRACVNPFNIWLASYHPVARASLQLRLQSGPHLVRVTLQSRVRRRPSRSTPCGWRRYGHPAKSRP